MDAFDRRLHRLVERVMALPATIDLPPGVATDLRPVDALDRP
jgi:hypothetical protein